jgi:hypothetical protein
MRAICSWTLKPLIMNDSEAGMAAGRTLPAAHRGIFRTSRGACPRAPIRNPQFSDCRKQLHTAAFPGDARCPAGRDDRANFQVRVGWHQSRADPVLTPCSPRQDGVSTGSARRQHGSRCGSSWSFLQGNGWQGNGLRNSGGRKVAGSYSPEVSARHPFDEVADEVRDEVAFRSSGDNLSPKS